MFKRFVLHSDSESESEREEAKTVHEATVHQDPDEDQNLDEAHDHEATVHHDHEATVHQDPDEEQNLDEAHDQAQPEDHEENQNRPLSSASNISGLGLRDLNIEDDPDDPAEIEKEDKKEPSDREERLPLPIPSPVTIPTNASSVKQLFQERWKDLDELASSRYASYHLKNKKLENRDVHQNVCNILANKYKIEEHTQAGQKKYREKVLKQYHHLKNLGFPVQVINDDINDALKNARSQTRIFNFFTKIAPSSSSSTALGASSSSTALGASSSSNVPSAGCSSSTTGPGSSASGSTKTSGFTKFFKKVASPATGTLFFTSKLY